MKVSSVSIKTTEYYKPHFGFIQSKMSVIGYDNSNKEILEYKFTNRDFFYSWLDSLKLKIKKGFIFKGSSEIGIYKFEKDKS